MSVIGKKPFVDRILDKCTKEQAQEIINCMNRLGEPTLVALYGNDNLISSANIGVSYVTFKMNEILALIPTGILVYIDNNHCAFFVVNVNSDSITEYSIDPVERKYIIINENLTVEELRQVCGDRVSEINDMDVAGSQATTTIIRDALTNINGRVLTNFEATLHDEYWRPFPFYLITKGGNDLTEEQAADYMEYMTGSRFVPTYNYEKPQNSLFTMADGSIWKPQWMASGDNKGMRLFFVSDGAGGGGLPEATKAGQVLVSNEDLEFEERNAVPLADNLTSVPDMNDTVYANGPTGGLTDIATGEESYLREVKGYSIVWNQLGNVLTIVGHYYIRYNGASYSFFQCEQPTTGHIQLFDITRMFGGNENIPFSVESYTEYPVNGTIPAQNYSPIIGFWRLFPFLDFTSFTVDTGTIKNVKAAKLVESGQNLWDASTMEETGLLLPAGYRYEIYLNGNYNRINVSYNGTNFYDSLLQRYRRADGKYVWVYYPTRPVLIKSIAGQPAIVYVGFVHSGNYCLTTGSINNSSWAYTDMPIPAYVKHEYDIFGINGLNGIPDSSKNHCSIYDTVDTTRVGSVDLSTLNWTVEGDDYTATVPNLKEGAKIICSNLEVGTSILDNGIFNGEITVSGLGSPTGTLLYELAEPISTGVPAFEPIRIEVNDMGSEYFTGTDICPVNQVSYYYQNLKDKLVNLKIPEINAVAFNENNEPLAGLKINDTEYALCKYERKKYEWTTNSFYYNYGIGPSTVATPGNLSRGNYYIGWGTMGSTTNCILIGKGSFGQFADNCLIVGSGTVGQASYDTVVGIGAVSYRGNNVTIGYNAKSGFDNAYNSTSYSVVIGARSQNMINNCVSFDGTDFKRSIHMYSPEDIFFRNDYVHMAQSGWKNFDAYTQGHRLSEYIQNNVMVNDTVDLTKYYISYTDANNYKTFTGNKASGTFTAIDKLIRGVHITVILTDNDTTPTWHSVVGMDLMLYDSTNSLPYNSYARIDCGGTVEDIIAYIDADGCVVITAPTGTIISSVKYNIK